MCPSVPDPDNGDVSYTAFANSEGTFSFDTVATYLCDEGYGQQEGGIVRRCVGNGNSSLGEFSGVPTTCEGDGLSKCELLKIFVYAYQFLFQKYSTYVPLFDCCRNNMH